MWSPEENVIFARNFGVRNFSLIAASIPSPSNACPFLDDNPSFHWLLSMVSWIFMNLVLLLLPTCANQQILTFIVGKKKSDIAYCCRGGGGPDYSGCPCYTWQ
ncbi:hypothetical protein DsansV1_C07g0077311 [Dioscorea sansibarensis]